MSIADNFPTYKEYAENAGETLEKVAKYAEAAKELEEAGKSLTKLQEIAKDLTWVSKLAAGFQIASAVLGILGELFGAKSPQEQIMDELDEISDQISDLQNQIASLGRQVNLDISDDKLFDYWTNVQTANGHIASYKYKIKHNEDATEVISLIQKQSTDIYFQAANALLEVLQGDGSTPAYLDEIYDKYYGDPGVVLYFECYFKRMLDEITQGHAAMLVCQAKLKLEDGQTLAPEKALEISQASLGDPQDTGSLEFVHDKIVGILTDCIHRVNNTDNLNASVTNFLDDNIKDTLASDHNWDRACQSVLQLLSDQYGTMLFCIVGYAGKNMLHKYGSMAAGDMSPKIILNYMNHEAAYLGISNFAIYGYPRANDNEPKILLTPQGKISNTADTPDAKKRLTFEYFSKAVNTAWKAEKRKDQVVFNLIPFWSKAKADAKAANSPEAAENVVNDMEAKASPPPVSGFNNDFVWIGRPKGWNSGEDAGYYFGIASQMPIAIHEYGRIALNGEPITDKLACVLCYPTLE